MASGAMRRIVALALALGLTLAGCAAETSVVLGTAREDVDVVRLAPPKPCEWRHVFQESVQTFEHYKERMAGSDVRPLGERIALVPFRGETQTPDVETLRLLEEFLEVYFTTRVDLYSARALPDTVRRRPSRGFGTQVLADDVLRIMSSTARGDPRQFWVPVPVFGDGYFGFADALLGIVQTDLYGSSPDGGYLDFVFGMGAYGQKVAVISPARYSIRYEGQPVGITLRKRFFKVAAHELGHVFGIAHCQTYACCMNGSNSLPEADRRPIHLCPECVEKLEWYLGFDRRERCRALADVYRKLGWEKETEFAARRAALEPAAPAREGEVPQ